ncbi:protein LNK3-like isoform X1 [Arachis stenosperma]|uniref:protein LNK3-like isoform X1 n=1 Tax=Arachis stenosperma TaxID=217475 RepID=UPI0025AD733E|nr:protein LNK3-like isoform X1 [Arachis stenosperma]
MDCYDGHGIHDFILPKYEDLFNACSPENWSRWELSAPNAREVELSYIDKYFIEKIDLGASQQDSSSVCGPQPSQQMAFSHNEPNYELQDLSSFEQIDDIFVDSLFEGPPCVENSQKSFFLCPEKCCCNIPDQLQKDFEASTFVPCDSESKDCLDVEEPMFEELDAFEWCSRDETMDEQFSLEESILQNLETVIVQFNEKTRICFRDALNRLARNTKQQAAGENQNQDLYMVKAIPQAVHGLTERSEEKEPMESETNIVDRAVANLLFNKMDLNLQHVFLQQSTRDEK